MRFSRAVAEPEVPAERAAGPKLPPRPVTVAVDSGLSSRGVAFVVAVMLMFVVQSRVSELIFMRVGSDAYLGKILFVAGLVLSVITGAWRRAVSNRPAILLGLLTAVFLLDVPFSLWKGGSAHLLADLWLKALAYFVVIAGSLATVPQCRVAIYTVGMSGALIAIQSRFFAAESSQRLQLEAGSLGNPNDLAFALILSIPCCLLLVVRPGGKFVKIVGALLAALFFVSAIQTGSRGGLIVLGVMLAVIFWTSSVAFRVIEALGILVLVVLSIAIAPDDVLERYRLLLSGDLAENAEVSWETSAAVGSTESRKELLKKSLMMTLQHPLVGVGPGMFPVAVADEHKESPDSSDEAAAWRETHNSYTQISSECGLPAVALFIALLVYALRANLRMYRNFRNREDLAEARACAYCLMLAVIAYAVNAVFMSIGYGFALPMLAALTVCLERASADSVRAVSPRPASSPA